jgi:hypothetical protein
LDCNYATFRSTQTNTVNNTVFERGNTGITASTNRFNYIIKSNRFNNVNVGVNIPLSSGSFTYGVSTYTGILVSEMNISQNYFGAQLTNTTSITNQFMHIAVAVTGPGSSSWWYNPSLGLSVNTNTINRVYRGTYINGSQMNPAIIKDNSIILVNDGQFGTSFNSQYGISVSSCSAHAVQTNTISAANTTNTLVTLIYSGSNSGVSVLCNSLSTAYQGFVFNAPHTGTNLWKGNKMQTLQRGFVLSNNGQIGQQGSNGNPIDNQWNGSGWTGSNNGTYIDATSDAQFSKLWTRNTAPWMPPNAGYPIGYLSQSYGVTANTPTTATGSYNCGGGGNPPPGGNRMMSSAYDEPNYYAGSSNFRTLAAEMNETEYIEATANYRYLIQHDSIRQSDTALQAFCDALAGSSIEKFFLADENLRNNDINQARNLAESVNPVNNVEATYRLFYNLNHNQLTNEFTETDSTSLYEVANRCPGVDGEAVYYARSLYNAIYATVYKFNEDCETNSVARIMAVNKYNNNSFRMKLFPNPTSGYIRIETTEDGLMPYVIKDVAGKILLNGNLNVKNNFANLNVDLNNGVYLITITDSNGSTTKKIIINK